MSNLSAPSLSSASEPALLAPARRPFLALDVSERRVLLATLDVGLIILVIWIASWAAAGPVSIPLIVLSLPAVWLGVGQITGIYDLATAARPRRCLIALSWTATVFTLFLTVAFYLDPYVASRPKLMILAIGTPIAIGLWRLTYIRSLSSGQFERRVLLVGSGPPAVAVLEAIQGTSGHGVTPVAVLDGDPAVHGGRLYDVPVLAGYSGLSRLAGELGVEEVVLPINQPMTEVLMEEIALCYEHGLSVSLMPHLYEEVTGQVPVEHVAFHWFGAVPLGRAGGMYASFKRTLDLLVATAGIILTAPIMLLAALLVRVSSPGPILYRQTRVGLRGQPFQIVKFRTMRDDAERPGEAVWATRNDPRTTAVGKWLRRTHLDELPQLFLVLEGRMSLVGPRPERPEFVRDLERTLPLYTFRHSVRPGVTGWAQIQYPYGSSLDDALAKLRYDLYYVKNRSLLLDVLIIVRTAARVLGLRGR